MTKQNENQRAYDAAKKAKCLSPSLQYAIVTVLPNIVNGAFWGFTDIKGVHEHLEAIKNSGNNIIARKLANDCLIEVQPNYLISAVQSIDSSMIRNEDLNIMLTRRTEAQVSLEKFLIAKGKTVGKTGQHFGGTIGIYCINDVTTITHKGVNYPAFRTNMVDTLMLLHKYGYMVQVGKNFVPADQAVNMGEALWGSAMVSPTKTGIFINIKSTKSIEEIKSLEKTFKNLEKTFKGK